MIRIENCSMGDHTSFRCGGRAALFCIPEDLEELRSIVSEAKKSGRPYLFMGNGSNMLFSDDGYNGYVISLKGLKECSVKLFDKSGAPVNAENADGFRVSYGIIEAGAGCSLASAARAALENGLAGFEFASGIPGSLGGAVFMNAGAYGGEMKDVLFSVCTMDENGDVREWQADELDLSYRHSVFMDNRSLIIVSARIRLNAGPREEIEEKMKDLARRRQEKQPLQYPSAGSTFKRPEGHFAGKLIEDAGLKGLTVGGAQVSELHAGFIINRGGATATDVLELIDVVRETVLDRSGVLLEPEVQIVGAWKKGHSN